MFLHVFLYNFGMFLYSRLNYLGVFPVPWCPPGVRVAKGLPSVFFFCVKGISLCCSILPRSPLASATSCKLPQTVTYSSISLQQALPILALTDRPPFCMRQNMELFHPVRSCTHLFSTSKTQGLCGVMIGFLLCNLPEFSPTRLHYVILHARMHACTHTHCTLWFETVSVMQW